MSVRNRITQIYKSRLNILNILQTIYDYDIDDYSGFSINEVDTMESHGQLDMLLTHKKESTEESNASPSEEGESEGGASNKQALVPISKTYILYYLKGSTLNSQAISAIVEDLFTTTETLTTKDCLCIIYEGEPNDSMIKYLNYLYAKENIFVVVHNLFRLQFNILEHSLVPRVNILSDAEVEELKKKFTIDSMSQLPEISRYDPQALAICLRPGQVCRFIRNSPTAMQAPYYRVCI